MTQTSKKALTNSEVLRQIRLKLLFTKPAAYQKPTAEEIQKQIHAASKGWKL